MILSASQIIGLIEIETVEGELSESHAPLAGEERTLAELLAWLTGTAASFGDGDAGRAAAALGTNRVAGFLAPESEASLTADLARLAVELDHAAAQFRLQLAAISAG
jgi:hypothetical protein